MSTVVALPYKPITALWKLIYVIYRTVSQIQVSKFECDNYMLLAFKNIIIVSI